MNSNRFVTLAFLLSVTLLLPACDGGGNGEKQPADTAADTTKAPAKETRSPEQTDAASDTAPAPAETATTGTGDAANGKALFKQPVIGGVPGCSTCHSLEPGVRMVGPSLADAATVAANTAEGMSTQEFLRQSIVDPNAHVTKGFSPGLMFQDYKKKLSEKQINDLVAFLMTQK